MIERAVGPRPHAGETLKRGLAQAKRRRVLLRLEREMRTSRRRCMFSEEALEDVRRRAARRAPQPYERQLERARRTQREATEQLRQLGRPLGP